MRSVMNRFKLWSGGLATSLMVLVTASAAAQGTGGAGEWTMTGRTPDLQRYSPLTQINKANVKSLKAAWSFSTGVLNGHEGNPLVIGNVMYVHSAFPNIVFAPGFVRSSADTIFGKALCTYITLPITSGFPSWPFRTPVENVHLATRFFTFARLIEASGLYRCRSYVRPVMVHSPGAWAAADAATSTIRLAASPPEHSLKRSIAYLMRMVKNDLRYFARASPRPSGTFPGGPRSHQATAIVRVLIPDTGIAALG